jgi:hypothetical protein
MAAAVLAGYPQVMLALGEPQALLRFNVVKLIGYGGAVLVAVHWGLTGLAITVAVVQIGIVVAAYRFMLGPRLGLGMRRIGTELGPACVGCLGLWVVCVPLYEALRHVLPAPLLLAVVGLCGIGAHCLVLRFAFGVVWSDLTALAGRVLPARRLRRPAAAKVAEAPSAG